MEWKIIPITAATEPKPAAIANIKTQSTVGTARTTVINALIVLLTHGFDRLTAVPNAKKSEITAPKIVDKNASDKVIVTCHSAFDQVVLFKLGDKNICLRLSSVIGMACVKSRPAYSIITTPITVNIADPNNNPFKTLCPLLGLETLMQPFLLRSTRAVIIKSPF